MNSGGELRYYQRSALSALESTGGPFKSLVMPTGSGKTRVGLKYAEQFLFDKSVAYICETKAHAEQVIREAGIIDVDAEMILGKHNPDASPDRDIHLQDYAASIHVGVFPYNAYFLGSGVDRAEVLIIDDAHAINSQDLSHSVVEIRREKFNRQFDKLLEILGEQNPLLKQRIESIQTPVHRGGKTVLVPPPSSEKTAAQLREAIESLAEGSSWYKHFLRSRLGDSPQFIYWPCVITLNSICWRPFILPFESFGNQPNRRIKESELVLLTSIGDSEELLQGRVGLSQGINEAVPEEEPQEMGSRLVVPYPKLGSPAPPSNSHLNIVTQWAERFGSVMVSMASDQTFGDLSENLNGDIAVLRYRSDESIADFESLPKPRVLALVNRPSGVDIRSSTCQIGIHLDLPYSTVGHEVVAGDIQESGMASDASLAIRLSQLLGRLNREPDDRSVHLILAGELPLRSGSAFVESLDPAVLLDLLIGQYGIHREYRLPNDEGLIDVASQFIEGDDTPRSKHLDKASQLREKFLSGGVDKFDPGITNEVRANLLTSRGNYAEAASNFNAIATEASQRGFPAHASFYEILTLFLAKAGDDVTDQLGETPEVIAERALSRDPPSGSIVAALRQVRSPEEPPSEELDEYVAKVDAKREARYSYSRFCDRYEDDIPSESDRKSVEAWKPFWREALTVDGHDTLRDNYCELFELLGSDTPEKEIEDNDAKVSWTLPSGEEFTLAIEAKGWDKSETSDPPEVRPEDVVQARDNAIKIDADDVLLVTSKRGRHRLVPKKADELNVYVLKHNGATALADEMTKQCVVLEEVKSDVKSHNDIPLDVFWFGEILERMEPGVIDRGHL